MTRSCSLALLVLLAFAVAAHGADSPATQVDTAWSRGMKANDVDAVMKCYAPDAIAALPGAPLARGDQAIRATYEGLLSANTVTDASVSEIAHRVMGRSAVAWGTFSLTLTPKAGGAPVTMTGRYTEVLERRGNRWVYVVDHASADPSPAESMTK